MNDVTLEIPDNVDTCGCPTWRDRMAFEFAKQLHAKLLGAEGNLMDEEQIARRSYRLADRMIAESIGDDE